MSVNSAVGQLLPFMKSLLDTYSPLDNPIKINTNILTKPGKFFYYQK